MAILLNGKDVPNASLAECYVTIEGNRYNLMNAKSLEASINFDKSEIPILGKTGRDNRKNGWSGSGTLSQYYTTTIFKELAKRYKDTGEDFYFDIQVTNEDPTTDLGRQTILLKQCNLDSMTLAKFDIESEYLDEDMDFTFDDFEIPESFNLLDGMQ